MFYRLTCKYSRQFELKLSNLDSLVHQTSSCWFSVQSLCNVEYLSLSSLFPSLMVFTATFPLKPCLVRLLWTVDESTEGLNASLTSADFFSLYLKDITFRCCSSVVFRPFLLSSPCPVSWFFLRKLFSKVFIALWGITLLINKYSFIPVKLCYCQHFSYIQLKKGEQILCFCVRLLVTKCLKIEYISGSLLSCLLYVDNSLVHHLV